MSTQNNLKDIGSYFKIEGEFLSAEKYGSGHINDTYLFKYTKGENIKKYIIQKINSKIFKDIPSMMQNISQVTNHIKDKLSFNNDKSFAQNTLTLIPSIEDKSYYIDDNSDYWRAFNYIENSITYNVVPSVDIAYEAAKVLGNFHKMLQDFPASDLKETIPDFHNTPIRFKSFEEAIAADKIKRVTNASSEIAFALERKSITNRFIKLINEGKVKEQVVHNDTKINNFLFDQKTGKGLCLIDLDTVMPGIALFDFGDIVRSAANSANEDEPDLSKVSFQLPIFERLVSGYLSTAGSFLSEQEVKNLPFAGLLITLETGIRFLTDYLKGDTYFKIQYPDHNLIRCRAQFKLVKEMEDKFDIMQKMVSLAV